MPRRDPDERELEAVRPDAPGADDPVLRRLGAAARSVTEEDARFEEPPAGLWDRIAAASVAGPADPAGPADAAGPAGGGATVHPLARRRTAWTLGAAAAVVIGVVVAIAVGRGGDGDGDVLASTRLEPLAAAEPATAELVEDGGGLRLDLPLPEDDLPPTDGFYEVWLIDPAVERLVSLGPVRPDARYAVPASIDYRDFPIVDVSVEPADGDPAHSGDSILRGTLR